jgi:hypothetical protein
MLAGSEVFMPSAGTAIRNIFGKLGADSRVEVARIVERADRAQASMSPRRMA